MEVNRQKVLGIKHADDVRGWLAAIPELGLLAARLDVKVFHAGSDAELAPDVWRETARFIYAERDQYAGFVILSGITNIPYFYHCLSLMLPHPDRPIVFTGSQIPDYFIKDAADLPQFITKSDDVGIRANLVNCLQIVACGLKGVFIMFGDKLIAGPRISFKAPLLAMPYDYHPDDVVGNVEFSIKLTSQYENKIKNTGRAPMVLIDSLETRILYLTANPLLVINELAAELKKYQGVIFNLPSNIYYTDNLIDLLISYKLSIPIVLCHRDFLVPTDQTRPQRLARHGIYLLSVKSPEEMLTRFMWILGQTKDRQKIYECLLFHN